MIGISCTCASDPTNFLYFIIFCNLSCIFHTKEETENQFSFDMIISLTMSCDRLLPLAVRLSSFIHYRFLQNWIEYWMQLTLLIRGSLLFTRVISYCTSFHPPNSSLYPCQFILIFFHDICHNIRDETKPKILVSPSYVELRKMTSLTM